ncbi:MAG: hypothetical protein PHN56_03675, partial [Candidatus Nanoarchaeia archaeon]|nr:hypothetical protein [Candidatus Nanoarchaeia archaeon]
IPVFVSGDYVFSKLKLGSDFSCGVLTNGSGVCWGNSYYGQLGDGIVSEEDAGTNLPVFIINDYLFEEINPGFEHSCGLLTNGSTVCWGTNWDGELGKGVYFSKSEVSEIIPDEYNFINSNYYWNKDTFISLFPSSYYSDPSDVTFECVAMNATSSSLPKSASI